MGCEMSAQEVALRRCSNNDGPNPGAQRVRTRLHYATIPFFKRTWLCTLPPFHRRCLRTSVVDSLPRYFLTFLTSLERLLCLLDLYASDRERGQSSEMNNLSSMVKSPHATLPIPAFTNAVGEHLQGLQTCLSQSRKVCGMMLTIEFKLIESKSYRPSAVVIRCCIFCSRVPS